MRTRSPGEARRTTARCRASSPSMVSCAAPRSAGPAKKKGGCPLMKKLLCVNMNDYHRFSHKESRSGVEGGANLAEEAVLLLDMLPPDGGEAPEELGLLVAQVGRDLDADLDEQIAPARSAEPGDALAPQAHHLAGLGAGGDGHGGRAVKGLDVDPGTERGLGHGDHERREQVVAAAVEPIMGSHAHRHVEVTDPAAA